MTLSLLAAQGALDLLQSFGPTHAAAGLDHGPVMAASQHLADAHAAAPHTMLVAAQDPAPAAGGLSADEYAKRVQQLSSGQREEQLGWLATAGKHFIGVFQKGGEVFVSFMTGIIPTLIVLMTAFYALTGIVGEHRIQSLARLAGRTALTRYTLLPLLAVFFLTNPMAYTFGTFLEEKHKPAFYDSAVSFVHPILGLFPHANPGEYFVWAGVLAALLELERRGALPGGYHITIAIYYFAVGLVVCLLKGILTERITAILARREGVTL